MMFEELRKGIAKSERGWRQIAEAERQIRRLERAGRPASYSKDLWEDVRVKLSVLGHQLLLILGIAVANVIFFGLLILVFPYIWEWFWSFP